MVVSVSFFMTWCFLDAKLTIRLYKFKKSVLENVYTFFEILSKGYEKSKIEYPKVIFGMSWNDFDNIFASEIAK